MAILRFYSTDAVHSSKLSTVLSELQKVIFLFMQFNAYSIDFARKSVPTSL